MEDKQRSVLRGPIEPHWACGCGVATNWACQVWCQCGPEAPVGIRHKALQADKEWKKQERTSSDKNRAVAGGSDERLARMVEHVVRERIPKTAWSDQTGSGRQQHAAHATTAPPGPAAGPRRQFPTRPSFI